MSDEILVEDPTPTPSVETKPAADLAVEPEKTVPYERFKDVIKERNDYKELLEAQSSTSQPTPKKQEDPAAPKADSYDDALKVVDSRIDERVNKKLDMMNKRIELDRAIASHPDFGQYTDLIKAKVKENPHLSFEDAYKLSRYEATIIEAQEAGKKAAYKKIEEKKAAGVETPSRAKPVNTGNGEIDPMAKGPDGKYLYSTKELEDLLR